MHRTLLLSLILACQVAAQEPQTVSVHRSARSLPLSNGATTATFDVERGVIDGFANHMYKKYGPHSVSVDLCEEANLAITPALKNSNVEYLNGTGVIHTVAFDDTLRFDRYLFAPMTGLDGKDSPQRSLVMLGKVTNLGATPLPDAEVTALLDFQVGDGGRPDADDLGDGVEHQWSGTLNERLESVDARTAVEWSPKQPHLLAYRTLGPGAKIALQGETEKTVSVGWDLTGLPAGGERWVGVVIAHEEASHFSSKDWPAAAQEKFTTSFSTMNESPSALLENERLFWNRYHADEPSLDHLPTAQQEVYRQSTAFLKMGQVQEREHPESSGQILASLKDKWARCWVRDASYAIVALAHSNHLQEAESAVDFLGRTRKESKHNYLEMINATLPADRQLASYLVSVCRYWGSGEEESDWNDHGPNIEYDNFGLFLWAYCEVADALPTERRQAFLARHQTAVESGVAEALITLQQPDGLSAPDSSIWEHHWDLPLQYDGRRHYTYSNITAWRGLKSYAKLLKTEGLDAGRYETAAARLKVAIQTELVDAQGALVSSSEDLELHPDRARDASVLEAVNWGLLDQPSPTMRALTRELTSTTPGSPGFFRNDDGNWYDRQEWLLLDLRGASAWRALGEEKKAEALIDWVTRLAQANFNALGELLDENGDFQGPFPMAGFGPGAYVLATTPKAKQAKR